MLVRASMCPSSPSDEVLDGKYAGRIITAGRQRLKTMAANEAEGDKLEKPLKRNGHRTVTTNSARSNATSGLLVRQNGGRTESRAFDFYDVAGYIVSVTMTIKLPRFAIAGFDLSLPWQSYVWWLADPRDRVAHTPVYRFGRDYILEYNRLQVLNHLADVRRVRSRGESLQGYLLGIGNDPIPEQFEQGAIIPAFLIVYDQYGEGHRSPLSLWTDRTGRYFQHPSSGQLRKGGLLDKSDPPSAPTPRRDITPSAHGTLAGAD
jgi:hypothetical protein